MKARRDVATGDDTTDYINVGRKAALLPCFDEKFTNTPTDGSNQCQSGGGKFEIPHTLVRETF